MGDFIEAKNLLEKAGAGIEVKTEDELYKIAGEMLSDAVELEKRGRAGKEIIMSKKGAAERNVELIKELIRK
jgi:3-deoxy-D-manno-octulosonic-acid transferase